MSRHSSDVDLELLSTSNFVITNATTGVQTTVDMTEIAALDAIGAADLAKIDGITNGVAAINKALVLGASGEIATITSATITTMTSTTTNATTVDTTNIEVTNLKAKDGTAVAVITDATGVMSYSKEVALDGNTLAVEAGAGITGGVGTVYKSSVVKVGGIIKTSILIDLTGLSSSTTDLDIIGQGVSVAHLGQITAARNGTILTGRITCLEAPVGGVTDIDLYSATEGTGVFDGLVTDLTETALLTSGAAWTIARVLATTAVPAADQYLYLTCGAAGTPAAYSAGKFLIELEGYDA